MGGNPRLSSLDQIAENLDSVLVLVPQSKLQSIERLLESDSLAHVDRGTQNKGQEEGLENSGIWIIKTPSTPHLFLKCGPSRGISLGA